MTIEENTRFIKNQAQELGFMYCGISKADYLEDEAPHLAAYLKNGWHGKMQWMENHFDKRLDPRKLVSGAKSVISLLFNYYPEERQKDPEAPKLAKYAYGIDYHFVIKDKLKELFKAIQEEIGEVEGRVFTDSAPVLDKAWAKRSGLGWIGKNALLITPQKGSFHFIGELIIDLPLVYDGPIKDYCGTCTRCIDACPTGALTPYKIEAKKCISYLTIELKDQLLPSEFKGKMENWMFGCDICQDVCPWNKFATPHQESLLTPRPKILEFTKAEWKEITEDIYKEIFKDSAVKRAKYEGLKRNIDFLFDKDE
ncbi:MAG: tRNA epoxyqueuosine(34) reductase QueG [Brumimicrobium sp.]|nr:tRNA epoxyqueuosine(34) reductase QueG [Brumimicrobium sp.]